MNSRLTFIIFFAVFVFSPFCMAKGQKRNNTSLGRVCVRAKWPIELNAEIQFRKYQQLPSPLHVNFILHIRGDDHSVDTSIPVKKWCYRQQKYSVVRYYNISTEPEIALDVGECRAEDDLSSNQAITKRSIDCVPNSLVMKRVLLYNTFMVEMERVLTCQKVPSTCQRLPRMVTYYPGTMYRRTIDVGACGGLCQDEMTCKPTKITTVAISTPNGKRSIEVIQDCSCVTPHCYRVSAFEAFPEQYTDSKGKTVVRTKLIDMGKCVDNNRCPIPEKHHWSFIFPEAFHIHREIRCSKNTTKMQSYVAIGGRHVKVATVDTCSCN